MPRELKPCGTMAAAKRHRRRGEKLDPACHRAEADARAARRKKPEAIARQQEEKAVAMAASAFDMAAAIASEPELTDVDPLADALENLRIVKAAMKHASPQAVPQLSKRRQELTTYVKTLQGTAKTQERTLKDELADARSARRARREAGA